ncbi:PhoD-like phosphatase-domain-containing protein [Dimargaris cristalligena]|uniref:PhoD-like phosphatase-domain-containing protein n=1 Tax=Dimargaris cristalligena TaxID=215637 RepID=A0A4P9ZQ92_9FUNG|nr:PhoD-like phosphatase-domain-containing protein [Dimargaris cristalligena]|eukprot:RKP35358.1 PhoD-like phosphatase-domain-containing protein [Dimargaris cristalligena]
MRAVKSILSLLNIVACSFVFDFAFVPYLFQPAHDLAFMRVGALTPQGAKVLVRDPEASSVQLWTTPLAIKDPVSRDAIMDRILHPAETVSSDTQASEGVPWTYALELNFPANQDFVQVAEFTTLEPSTYYAVKGVRRFANATETEINRVVFRTAPVRLTPAQAASSLTSPGVRFQFGTGSCIKPNFPYVPMSTSRLPGLRRLSRHPIEFMLFLGDFIYADVPYFFGPALEDYRRLYRQVYSDPDALPYLQKIPTIHIYDDHEILNDWDRRDAFPMSNALRAYEEYNGWANPDAPGQGKNAGSDAPSASSTSLPVNQRRPTYFDFEYGDVAFFVMDARRYRSHIRQPDSANKTMLGAEQKQYLFDWLRAVNHTHAFKFIASSVPLTKNWVWANGQTDTWAGYLTERSEILRVVATVPNVIFLTGDRHEAIDDRPIDFSTSPVNQFYVPLFDSFNTTTDLDDSIFYRREGNTKFGIFTVDTQSNPDQPTATYQLYTEEGDGQYPIFNFTVYGKKWRKG